MLTRMVLLVIVLIVFEVVAPVLPLTAAACYAQPSSIAVAVGEHFTVNCTTSCEDYQTHLWLIHNRTSLFAILPVGSIKRNDIQTCDNSNASNGTYELQILATEELRAVESIVCAVAFTADTVMPCLASASVEIRDEATNSTTDTDAENSCDVPKVFNVTEGKRMTINCTISCDTPPETVHWLVLNNNTMSSIFVIVPTATTRDPPESCDSSDIPEVTHQLLLNASNESDSLNIRCVASLRTGDDICVTSAIVNVEEAPYTDDPYITMATDRPQTTTVASTSLPESPTTTDGIPESDSYCQMACNFQLIVALLVFTVLFAVQ